MWHQSAHDGEASGLPACAGASVRLRLSLRDRLLGVLRWTLGLAGAVVVLWLGTAFLAAAPAAAAVAVPVVAGQQGLVKGGVIRPAGGGDGDSDSDSGGSDSSDGDSDSSGDDGKDESDKKSDKKSEKKDSDDESSDDEDSEKKSEKKSEKGSDEKDSDEKDSDKEKSEKKKSEKDSEDASEEKDADRRGEKKESERKPAEKNEPADEDDSDSDSVQSATAHREDSDENEDRADRDHADRDHAERADGGSDDADSDDPSGTADRDTDEDRRPSDGDRPGAQDDAGARDTDGRDGAAAGTEDEADDADDRAEAAWAVTADGGAADTAPERTGDEDADERDPDARDEEDAEASDDEQDESSHRAAEQKALDRVGDAGRTDDAADGDAADGDAAGETGLAGVEQDDRTDAAESRADGDDDRDSAEHAVPAAIERIDGDEPDVDDGEYRTSDSTRDRDREDTSDGARDLVRDVLWSVSDDTEISEADAERVVETAAAELDRDGGDVDRSRGTADASDEDEQVEQQRMSLLSERGPPDEDSSRKSDDGDRDDGDRDEDDSSVRTEQVLEDRIEVDESREELERERQALAAGTTTEADYDEKAAEHAELEKRAAENRAEASEDDVELVDEVVDGHRELGEREKELAAEERGVSSGAVDRETHEENVEDFEERRDEVYEATDDLMEAADREVRTVSEDDLDGEGATAGCDSDGAFTGCGSASESADGERHSERRLCVSGVSSGCGASSESGGSKAEASCDDAGCRSSASRRGADGKSTSASAKCTGDCDLNSRADRDGSEASCDTAGGSCDSRSRGSGVEEPEVSKAAEDGGGRVEGGGASVCEGSCRTSSFVDVDETVVAGAEVDCAEGCSGAASTTADAGTGDAEKAGAGNSGTATDGVSAGKAGCTVSGGDCAARSAAGDDAADAVVEVDCTATCEGKGTAVTSGSAGAERRSNGAASCVARGGACGGSSETRVDAGGTAGDTAVSGGDGSAFSAASASVDCRESQPCSGEAGAKTDGEVTVAPAVAGGPAPVRQTSAASTCAATDGGCVTDSASQVNDAAANSAPRSQQWREAPGRMVSSAGRELSAGSEAGAQVDCASATCAGRGWSTTSGAASGAVAGVRSSTGGASCTAHGAGGGCASQAGTTVADRAPTSDPAAVSGPVSVSHASASVECVGGIGECGGTSASSTSGRDTGVSPHARGTSATAECTVTGGGCSGGTSSAASSAPDFAVVDPSTGRPAAGPSSASSSSASLVCGAGTTCSGSVRTGTTAWDGAVANGTPRTSQGSASCTGAAGGCEVRSVSNASSGPGAAWALAGDGQVNAARLPAGPSAASAAGATMTCAGELACTGKVTSAATATDPVVSPSPRGSHSEGSCEGVSGGGCQAVTNSGASSGPDANVIAPLVAERSTADATVTSGTTGGQPQDGAPAQGGSAPLPAPAAPGASANSGAPTVPGASSWTMASATVDCAGGVTCAGAARSSAAGGDGPTAANDVNGARGPPAGSSTTSGSCATGVTGCWAQTSATAATGQVVADVIVEDRISTAVQLAEQAAQAEYDAAAAALIAYRADATPELKAAAADAVARAEQARAVASDAAELAVRPVTGAPATMSRSSGTAQCSGPGCAARTTGATTGVGGESTTAASCTAAASGCAVTSEASVSTAGAAVVDAAGTPMPATSVSGQSRSVAVCPDAGCTATLAGSATAGGGTPNRSTAAGETVCTGVAACGAEVSAGSTAAATAAGARPAEQFAASSAFVGARCDDGSETGCATRTSSTTDATGVGDPGVRGRSASTCAATGGCATETSGLSATGLAQAGAGCVGAGCRIRAAGTSATQASSGLIRAEARMSCAAGAGGGQCAGVGTAAAGVDGTFASASCQAVGAAACAESHADAGAAGGTRADSSAGCGAAGSCLTSVSAGAGHGDATAAAACEGSPACSFRARSQGSAAGATADAAAAGSGSGGQVRTTVSAGSGVASASAMCSGAAATRCTHSYSASASDHARGARASAAGSGGGGSGSGGVLVTAHASSGPGWAAASASCAGAANCRHSYSARASDSAAYHGAGPGGSTVHHTARASASGSGGGREGAGGVRVTAQAGAGPTGAGASASCSGARNCSAGFESHSVADAFHDPQHYAHANASCSGGGSGFCATSAVAMADEKSAQAGASCAGSAASCSYSYVAHSDAALETLGTTVNGGSDCGDGGGFGGGGCGTRAFTEIDENGVTRLYLACEGPGCRFSGVGDAGRGNYIAEGKAHQECGQTGEGWCVIGVKAELEPDRERENFSIDVLGFCAGSSGANCQGYYWSHVDVGDSTLGHCTGYGSGGCHGETLTGDGHPVLSSGVCIEGFECSWYANTHSDAGLETADEGLSADAYANCRTSSATGAACLTAAGLKTQNNEIVAFARCEGGVGPDCSYHAHTTGDYADRDNTATDGRTCGQQAAGYCAVSSFAGVLTDVTMDGQQAEHHGEAIAGGTCDGSSGTVCTGHFSTHVDSGRDTWSTCEGSGAGTCHGVADPWNANSTLEPGLGFVSGHIESASPDERRSESVDSSKPLTVGANTHETVGRWFINLGNEFEDAAVEDGLAAVQAVQDIKTHFGNFGRAAFGGEEVERLPGESDAEYDARVWPLKHRWDTNPVVVHLENFGDLAWTGEEEPRRPGESEEQYNARVWPLKYQWDQSMDTIDEIVSGDAGRDLFWRPIDTVSTAVSGPAMIVSGGYGALAVKPFLQAIGGGGDAGPGVGRIDVDGPARSGVDVGPWLSPDDNCVNAVCAFGAAASPDGVVPADIPKAGRGSHDPLTARDSVESTFDGRFLDSSNAGFERDTADAPDGTEAVVWSWRDGAPSSHMIYGRKAGGAWTFYDQRGRLTGDQARVQLDNTRKVLVRGSGRNGVTGSDVSNVPPVGSAQPGGQSYDPRSRSIEALDDDLDPTPRSGETAEQALARVLAADAELIRRATDTYEALGDTPPRINVRAHDAVHDRDVVHTIERHGPQIPLKREDAPNAEKTIDDRLRPETEWGVKPKNFSYRWLNESIMNRVVNDYLRDNWDEIRADLVLDGSHEKTLDYGKVVGEGFYNQNWGSSDKKPKYSQTSLFTITIDLAPARGPPVIRIIRAFPSVNGGSQ